MKGPVSSDTGPFCRLSFDARISGLSEAMLHIFANDYIINNRYWTVVRKTLTMNL